MTRLQLYAACFVTCSNRKGSHAYLRDITRNPRQPSGSFVYHQPRVLHILTQLRSDGAFAVLRFCLLGWSW